MFCQDQCHTTADLTIPSRLTFNSTFLGKLPRISGCCILHKNNVMKGAQWLSGKVLDSRPKGRGFEPRQRNYVVSLSKNINPSLVLVQPRKTCPYITERLLMGRKESNQTKTMSRRFGFWCYSSLRLLNLYCAISRKLNT